MKLHVMQAKVDSFGWSTLVVVTEASAEERAAVVEKLAEQLVARCGAPGLEGASGFHLKSNPAGGERWRASPATGAVRGVRPRGSPFRVVTR